MILELESGKTIKDPKHEDFPKALMELETEKSLFALLELDNGRFLQTTGNKKDGYTIEYQDGGIENHHQLKDRFSLEQVIDIFQKYSKGNYPWNKDIKTNVNKLSTAFGFTDEDLSSNKMNSLTPKQKKKVQQYLKGRNSGLKLAILIMAGSVIFFVVLTYLINDLDSPGFKSALPQLILAFSLFVGIFLFFTILGMVKSRDLNTGRISIAEGVVNKSIGGKKKKKYGGLLFKIGKIDFLLYTPAQYNAFEDGKRYQIYFVKNPNANIILSVKEF
jgi:hypothetical protein